VFVVLTKKNAPKIGRYLKDSYKGKITIRIETIEDGSDSADALRAVQKYITVCCPYYISNTIEQSDFVVMSDDLVIDVPFVKVANIHRSHNSAVTMVLKQHPKHEGSSGEEAEKTKQTDFFGLVDYNPHITSTFTDTKHAASSKSALFRHPCRVAYFSPSSELENSLVVGRSFLRKWSNVLLSKSFTDSHFYIFSKWVLELIVAQKEMKSLKHEFLPYLIDTQRFVKRKLQRSMKEGNFRTLTDFVDSDQDYEIVPGVNVKSLLRTQQSAFEMSSSAHDQLDLVRCNAFVIQSVVKGGKAPTEGQYAKRATNLASYMEINRDVSIFNIIHLIF
jgi:translation initiation factor eIF-2B subunit gamma